MIRKTLKFLLWTLLLLLLLLLGLVYYLLYTASGSQRLISYGLTQSGLDLNYQQATGNLAQGMQFTQLSLVTPGVEVELARFSYEANWSWFNRHLELPQVTADQLRINLSESNSQSTAAAPFTGIELPLSIDLQALKVNDLVLISGGTEQPPMQLDMAATMRGSDAAVKQLQLLAAGQLQLQVNGQLDLQSGVAYDLTTVWQQQTPAQAWRMEGRVHGDLSAITVNQLVDFTTGQVSGQLSLDGSATQLTAAPVLGLEWQADELLFDTGQQQLQAQAMSGQLTGGMDAYELVLDADLQHAQLPSSPFKLRAQGSRSGLRTQSAQLTTPAGTVDLVAEINWETALQLDGRLQLDALNPAQLLSDWPGSVSGHMDVMAQFDDQGYRVISENNQLQGNLKGQPFDLSGDAQWINGSLYAEQLQLSLGANQLFIDGEVSAQQADLTLNLTWQDLSMLTAGLGGSVTAELGLSGSPLTPTFDLRLQGQDLVYADSQLNSLSVSSQGVWNEAADTQVNLGAGRLAGVELTSLELQQTGWLADHEIKLDWVQDQLSSQLQLQGQYQSDPTAKWRGQVVTHDIQFAQNQQLSLQQPIDLSFAADIEVSPACWQGDALGELCVTLQRQPQDDSLHAAVSLQEFSLSPWQVWLPDNLQVLGELQGSADLQLAGDELSVTADFSMAAGEVLVSQANETVYQSGIDVLQLNIQSQGQRSQAALDLQLASGDFLHAEGQLQTPVNQAWQLQAQLEGEFKEPDYLVALSEEISAIQGQIKLAGEVSGDLMAPKLKLQLTQPQGHIKLTRLGAAIEDWQLTIGTQDFKQPRYQIQFSGSNTPSINQGHIKSEGELLMASQGWQYQGQITGDDFLLLNLPEIKFKVSPDLRIQADQQQLDIQGDVLIPYGHVLIEQLPESTVTNSSDLVIHDETVNTTAAYPVTMQINAQIEDRIELDVIGLKADLTGGIQLRQDQKQNLKGFGELNLVDGSYEIYGQQLDIATGALTFTGALDNPRLDVKASRQSISGDVVAGVELGGTVNNLQSQLFSEPNLPEIEKLSYIMTGRGIDNGGNLDGESLKQAAIVMGLNQSSPIFNQIQNQFGIDVLTIKESAVAADTVVEAGKKINDRLYVSYNQGLFNRLGFWVLKYRINQFLNLQTTQGENQSIELVYTRRAQTPDDAQ